MQISNKLPGLSSGKIPPHLYLLLCCCSSSNEYIDIHRYFSYFSKTSKDLILYPQDEQEYS